MVLLKIYFLRNYRNFNRMINCWQIERWIHFSLRNLSTHIWPKIFLDFLVKVRFWAKRVKLSQNWSKIHEISPNIWMRPKKFLMEKCVSYFFSKREHSSKKITVFTKKAFLYQPERRTKTFWTRSLKFGERFSTN